MQSPLIMGLEGENKLNGNETIKLHTQTTEFMHNLASGGHLNLKMLSNKLERVYTVLHGANKIKCHGAIMALILLRCQYFLHA